MPNRSLSTLTPDFQTDVGTLLSRCRARGVVMRPYTTLRTPLEQAVLWRQSRTTEQIERKIAELWAKGAEYLAGVLAAAGPQHGRHVTNALPGLSWHQWGQAVDCFWEREEGRAEWSTRRTGADGGPNGYRVYAKEAARMGLEPGGWWRSFKDWPHVQKVSSRVLDVATWREVDETMRVRFLAS